MIDTTFDRKVGRLIDGSRKQECADIGDNAYMKMGPTKVKVTLDGSLVYSFNI